MKIEINEMISSSEEVPPFLRTLREKRMISQTQLAARAQISRREVQGIESKAFGELKVRDIRLFASGLGVDPAELMKFIEAGGQKDFGISRCSLDQPLLSTRFSKGSELFSFVEKGSGEFIGILQLDVNSSISRESLFFQDFLFGMVLKGTLLLDNMGLERVFKERSCFCIRRHVPFTLQNNDSLNGVSLLLFSAGFSHA